jgi:hypothetical protein
MAILDSLDEPDDLLVVVGDGGPLDMLPRGVGRPPAMLRTRRTEGGQRKPYLQRGARGDVSHCWVPEESGQEQDEEQEDEEEEEEEGGGGGAAE